LVVSDVDVEVADCVEGFGAPGGVASRTEGVESQLGMSEGRFIAML
jgi:hypothetical protein